MHPSLKVPLDCIIFILLLDFACGTGGFITSWLKELAPQLFSHSIHGVEKKQFPYMLAVTNMLLHYIDEPDILHGNSLTRKVRTIRTRTSLTRY